MINSVNNAPSNPLLEPGQRQQLSFQKAEELPCSIYRSITNGETGRILVQDHPYMAVTDANGRFEMERVPNGEWTFQFWHPKIGFLQQVERDGKVQNWHKGRVQLKFEGNEVELGTIQVEVGKENYGTVVLRAIDIDNGKPLPGVEFCMANDAAEDWYRHVGTTNKQGLFSYKSASMPGYYFGVDRSPAGYKLVSIDDVDSNITEWRTVHHDFHFRKMPDKDPYPKTRQVPKDKPSPFPTNSNSDFEFSDMPGFEGRRVRFRISRYEDGKITAAQRRLAERIYYNGPRVFAIVKDELTYVQKAEPQDKGDIDGMKDVLIDIFPARANSKRHTAWRFWCRLPGGLHLRQNGYLVSFHDIERADLRIPDHIQPRR